jgi:hypothetical protein
VLPDRPVGNGATKGDVTVTDTDAATARRNNGRRALLTMTVLAAVATAGCETGGGLLGTTAPTQPQASVAPAPAPVVVQKRVAMAPVIGAPEAVARQLSDLVVQSANQQKLTLSTDVSQPTDFTLRGYIVAARERANIKLSYIWDVTDPTGKRVNRITGEEIVPANPANRDPWASASPAVLQTIATKSATSLAAWLPTQTAQPPAVAGSAPAVGPVAIGAPAVTAPTVAVGTPRAPSVSASVPPPPVQQASLPASPPQTGSIARAPVTAIVPGITGAPGDGNGALAGAIQRELARNGVALGDVASSRGTAYIVEARVALGQPKDGKQSIQIDWRVKDPKGKALGTVTQKNEVPQGSLDQTWGRTADAAAAAAAQGIVKLLPTGARTN